MANEEEDFAAMLAQHEAGAPKAARRPKVGDAVRGKVISIGKDAVFVDVGGKAEGLLDRNQVAGPDGALLVAVGNVVEARVVADAGGVLQLRIKIARGPEAKAELAQAQEFGLAVDGLVTEVVKGGLVVDVAGVRGFCPASQIDTRFTDDLSVFVGQRFQFRVTRYEPGARGNLVLSRRALLEEEQAKKAAEIKDRLVPGAVLRGKVTGFKPFGAFVDLGGIEGMLHISELGHSRVEKPEDVLALEQEIDVVVLKVEPPPEGKKGMRVSLSLKALAADPWNDATRGLGVGGRVKGTITRLQPFGAFVQIAPGVEGLLHISELGAGRRINHPKEVVQIGQEIEASIVALDVEKRRLSLSIASASDASPDEIRDATPAAPARLGTFADLFNKAKKK
ncbi:MAG: S1 RNA-binding domain-containing protein [Deltaproteobacteria bacterium]|nr:S1 RNA-binding domain-containing protein [Deltaproteobacteria bacterium]